MEQPELFASALWRELSKQQSCPLWAIGYDRRTASISLYANDLSYEATLVVADEASPDDAPAVVAHLLLMIKEHRIRCGERLVCLSVMGEAGEYPAFEPDRLMQMKRHHAASASGG